MSTGVEVISGRSPKKSVGLSVLTNTFSVPLNRMAFTVPPCTISSPSQSTPASQMVSFGL